MPTLPTYNNPLIRNSNVSSMPRPMTGAPMMSPMPGGGAGLMPNTQPQQPMQSPNMGGQSGGGMQSVQQASNKGGGGRGFGNTPMSISPTHKSPSAATKTGNSGCYDMPVTSPMSMTMPFPSGSTMPPMPSSSVSPDMNKLSNYLRQFDSAESKLLRYAIEMGKRAAHH